MNDEGDERASGRGLAGESWRSNAVGEGVMRRGARNAELPAAPLSWRLVGPSYASTASRQRKTEGSRATGEGGEAGTHGIALAVRRAGMSHRTSGPKRSNSQARSRARSEAGGGEGGRWWARQWETAEGGGGDGRTAEARDELVRGGGQGEWSSAREVLEDRGSWRRRGRLVYGRGSTWAAARGEGGWVRLVGQAEGGQAGAEGD